MKTIRVKMPVTGRRKMKYVHWYYLKDKSYCVTGDTGSINYWVRKNLDASESFLCYRYPLHNKQLDWMEVMLHSEKLEITLYHPYLNFEIMPYEKYINKAVKGDTTLEYTVTCYGKRKRWALVIIGHKNEIKLISTFRNIPRKYLRELDMTI